MKEKNETRNALLLTDSKPVSLSPTINFARVRKQQPVNHFFRTYFHSHLIDVVDAICSILCLDNEEKATEREREKEKK